MIDCTVNFKLFKKITSMASLAIRAVLGSSLSLLASLVVLVSWLDLLLQSIEDKFGIGVGLPHIKFEFYFQHRHFCPADARQKRLRFVLFCV